MAKKRRRKSRLVIVLALVAVIIIAAGLYVNYLSNSANQAVMVLNTLLEIEIGNASTGNTNFVYPQPNIGVPGGIMSTTRLLQYGVSGYYPVHTLDSKGLITVQSKVVRSYTLQDFFDVWGEPLGVSQTLTYSANYTGGHYNWFWDMCVQEPGQNNPTLSTDWGSHVLVDRETIQLVFSQVGCA